MKLPKKLFVYVADADTDDACLIAVADISEIPEDMHGELVGVYSSNGNAVFSVKKELQ